jgi:hypothetical protein
LDEEEVESGQESGDQMSLVEEDYEQKRLEESKKIYRSKRKRTISGTGGKIYSILSIGEIY